MAEPRKRPFTLEPPVVRVPRRPSTQLMPTLLDRLRDDAPQREVESPEEYTLTRRQIRDIVQRDLAYLLNATNIEDQIDRERYPYAAASTVNFGVPPLAGGFLVSRQWNDIERVIHRAITDFEPRLIPGSLVVSPREETNAGEHHNVLAFQVQGLVHMDPYPLEFTVQSSIDLDTSEIRTTGTRGN